MRYYTPYHDDKLLMTAEVFGMTFEVVAQFDAGDRSVGINPGWSITDCKLSEPADEELMAEYNVGALGQSFEPQDELRFKLEEAVESEAIDRYHGNGRE